VAQRTRYDEQGRFAGTSGTLDDMTERKAAEQALQELNVDLEERVRVRTAELEASNRELEAFSYSVSHDLRAPLRGIDGFSHILEDDYAEKLDESGRQHLARIRAASQRMAQLIDDLLELARITRASLNRQRVDLGVVARDIARELSETDPRRCVDIAIGAPLNAYADPVLTRVVLDNLMRNAWKFSGQRDQAQIVVDSIERDGETVFFVRDNGAGFDMAHAGQLFRPFQRLHAANEFSGTGVGLATVHRIVRRHGGRIWAESELDRGATFFFTLPERA
jgi:light-regulated signal transduction histidine kinase (bacteriophytochrome)